MTVAEPRRVAVTGLGVVSPAGHDLETFWRRVSGGDTAVGEIRTVPRERLSCRLLAEIDDFHAEEHFDRRAAAGMDRFAQFSVVAARRAIADAALDLALEDRDRVPVIFGTGVGGLTTLDASFAGFYGPGLGRPPPMTIPKSMLNAGASHISMDLGLRGECYAVASACASSTHAIGRAFRMVRGGEADIAVSGGAEACLTVGTIKGWEMLRVMSNEACRPFSAGRSGMVLGEGAAVVVLEELERARARGAHVYGLVAGFGATADAGEITTPNVDGPARAMAAAMRDAGLAPDMIDYVNAHGTGTVVNDATETSAIRRAFGAHADRLLVSSTKSVLGHGLGASGALEAVATLLAMTHSLAPPTAGWTGSDPSCDLDVVPNQARPASIGAALSNSFAFGGLNGVLAFTRA